MRLFCKCDELQKSVDRQFDFFTTNIANEYATLNERILGLEVKFKQLEEATITMISREQNKILTATKKVEEALEKLPQAPRKKPVRKPTFKVSSQPSPRAFINMPQIIRSDLP